MFRPYITSSRMVTREDCAGRAELTDRIASVLSQGSVFNLNNFANDCRSERGVIE